MLIIEEFQKNILAGQYRVVPIFLWYLVVPCGTTWYRVVP